MQIGLALPQYDYSVPGESPLRWDTLREHAQRAEALGFDSLWLSDHLFLDIAKYGGTAEPHGIYEPLVTLAALARTVTRPRLGTLVSLPIADHPEESRPYFRRLRELAEEHGLAEVSMGTSQDYRVAVEEGATYVRVGAALFGDTRR